jgi:hypothetical protein
MKKLIERLLVLSILAVPAIANTLDVTNNSQVSLSNSDSLVFYISNPSSCLDHSASYPTEVQMLLGGMPLGGPVDSIPGTSGVYMAGMLFTGTLESADGSISIPLSDPNAARLGLPAGDMLLTPGSHSGGSYSGPVELLAAAANLNAHDSAALFASGEATVHLRNIGQSITFGYPDSSITSDFSASLVSGGGAQSEGARVLRVDCTTAPTPEPGTLGLLLLGLAIIIPRIIPRLSKR